MSEYLLSRILVFGMPLALGFKAIVFVILWVVLMLQKTETKLGIWINVFFFLHVLMGIQFFLLSKYLVSRISDTSYLNWDADEWSLLAGLNILPVLTAIAAIMVVKYMLFESVEGSKVEKRQREQQDVLDETSLILSKRGKVISEAGIELDTRSIQMNKDQREYDASHPEYTVSTDSEGRQGPCS